MAVVWRDVILFSTRERDGILITREEVPGDTVNYLHVKTKISKVLTLLGLRSWTSFHDDDHIELTGPMFDITLFSTRWGVAYKKFQIKLIDLETFGSLEAWSQPEVTLY